MTRISRRTFTTGIAATSAAAWMRNASAQATPSASPASSPAAMSDPKIDDAVRSALEKVGAPGASVFLTTMDGARLSSAVGIADVRTDRPITPDMAFRIGSITKSFTATRFLMLVDEGKATLDDTLAKLVPDYASLPNADKITARQLLSMRSGLPEYTSAPAFEEAWATDPTQPFDMPTLMGFIKDAKPQFEPGTTFRYTNTNYALIGEAIANITGKDIRAAIQDDVIDKVGLSRTTFAVNPRMKSPFARGYAYPSGLRILAEAQGTPMASPMSSPAASPAAGSNPDDPIDVTVINPSAANAAGAIVSTAQDVATWMNAVAEGTLLSESSRTAMMTFEDAGDGMGYGLGVFKVGPMIGHNGMIDGFQSLMIHLPDQKQTVAILVNAGPTKTGEEPTFAILEAISKM